MYGHAPFDSTGREVKFPLPTESAYVGVTGHFSAGLLDRWGWGLTPDECDGAVLVTGQLAANAVGHGRSRVSIGLTLAASTLLISVADRGSRPEARRPEDVRPALDSGRGLHMVGALSQRPWVRRARERIHRSSADVRRRDSYRAEAVLWAGQAPSASRAR